MLEHKPPHVRKRIALTWTGIIAVVLIVVLFLVYIGPKEQEEGEPRPRFGEFYETISNKTQSFFGGN